MLVAYAVASILGLRVMIGLLAVVLLVRLMLILVARAWLHESLVLSPIHHDVLTLLMALVVHCIRIVRRSLGYRRARGRRGVIGVATSATIHWGAGSGQMTRVVVLLIILAVIEWSSSREPVCSICHLTSLTGKETMQSRSSYLQLCDTQACNGGAGLARKSSFDHRHGIVVACVLRSRLRGLKSANLELLD